MSKSPVYRAGRNRKHRAPSGSFHAAAANINMRGKKSKAMSCECIDMRDKMLLNQHRKEIKLGVDN